MDDNLITGTHAITAMATLSAADDDELDTKIRRMIVTIRKKYVGSYVEVDRSVKRRTTKTGKRIANLAIRLKPVKQD